MMKRLVDTLASLNLRLVTGLMVFVVCLIVFEGWILVLRKPFTDFQQTRARHLALASTLSQSSNPSGELSLVTGELKQLTEKLHGQLRVPASDDEMAPALIAALDQSASRHGLTLASVSPQERKRVSVFENIPFEVSATGAYLPLCAWMLDFETSLGNNATVSEFDMKTAGASGKVSLSMNIALYRPLKINGAGP